jgi:hypothetical protein
MNLQYHCPADHKHDQRFFTRCEAPQEVRVVEFELTKPDAEASQKLVESLSMQLAHRLVNPENAAADKNSLLDCCDDMRAKGNSDQSLV